MEQVNLLPLTPEAEAAMRFAYQEAVRLHHQELGTKHILIGLIATRESAAGEVLYLLGLDLEPTRLMEERLKHTAELKEPVKPELNQPARDLLAYAAQEAQAANQEQISTGHLLLGLTRVENGVALDTLRHFEISPERVQSYRQELLLGGG
ncbi:MAG TPA: Clp protease N-terminal domain-containing protein [Chloroflexota bacterium]|nr:Clp protease N-terminal domain-containing protein [Chloroflexota bacterium]